MHSAVPQSHYEWPRCSRATQEIQFTTNANKKTGVSNCNVKQKDSVEGTITVYALTVRY